MLSNEDTEHKGQKIDKKEAQDILERYNAEKAAITERSKGDRAILVSALRNTCDNTASSDEVLKKLCEDLDVEVENFDDIKALKLEGKIIKALEKRKEGRVNKTAEKQDYSEREKEAEVARIKLGQEQITQ